MSSRINDGIFQVHCENCGHRNLAAIVPDPTNNWGMKVTQVPSDAQYQAILNTSDETLLTDYEQQKVAYPNFQNAFGSTYDKENIPSEPPYVEYVGNSGINEINTSTQASSPDQGHGHGNVVPVGDSELLLVSVDSSHNATPLSDVSDNVTSSVLSANPRSARRKVHHKKYTVKQDTDG